MNLDFLDNYWKQERVFCNKHFDALDSELMTRINSPGIPQDKIKTMYKGQKKWDIHFPAKKVAIEYKTIATEQQTQFVLKQQPKSPYKNLKRNIGNRIEEAMGSAIDVKHFDPDYKLGYIMVFTLQRSHNLLLPKKLTDDVTSKFDKMIKNGLYDFFCPMITFGMGDHLQLSTKYTFDKFINDINLIPSNNKKSLDDFFI